MYINSQPVLTAGITKPELLEDWIDYPDSLTDKLKLALGSIELEVILQKWLKPDWWDTHFLRIDDSSVFQREIIMRNKGIAYWYARSVIPRKCYNVDPVFFNRLENESIRNLIFDENRVKRINILSYPVNELNLEFYWVKKHIDSIQGTLWVRFAEFSFQDSELFYLVEILLPELENVL